MKCVSWNRASFRCSTKRAEPLLVLAPGFFDGPSLLACASISSDPLAQVVETDFVADLGLDSA